MCFIFVTLEVHVMSPFREYILFCFVLFLLFVLLYFFLSFLPVLNAALPISL